MLNSEGGAGIGVREKNTRDSTIPEDLISRTSVPQGVFENDLMGTPDLLIMYQSGNIPRSATVPQQVE